MKLRWPKTKIISRGLDRGQMNKYRAFETCDEQHDNGNN